MLAVAEQLAVEKGRELTRRTLQTAVDRQTKAVEKKGGRKKGRSKKRAVEKKAVEKKGAPTRRCSCGLKKAHHGSKARCVVTSAEELKVVRVYFRCVKCQAGGFSADERLGIDGRFSIAVQRLACLAAASWSFDVSSQRLTELCGLRISENTIREIAQSHGAAMNTWQNSDPQAVREFRAATGEPEFTTDGTSVNTTGGWREMKVGVFAKRPAGEATAPEEWATRSLPAPSARVAFAAIERSERFGRRWKAWSRRPGLFDTSCITLLADGAKWIWEEKRRHLTQAGGVLDIFHNLEHFAAASRSLYGDGTDAADEWLVSSQSAAASVPSS